MALNSIGSVQSSLISAVLASVPDAPAAAPTVDQSLTSSSQITVDYAAVTADGGDDIISYEVLMDDGEGGDFSSQIGLNIFNLKLSYTISTGIEKGSYYRFMYRARNSVGWGELSPIGYILAG